MKVLREKIQRLIEKLNKLEKNYRQVTAKDVMPP